MRARIAAVLLAVACADSPVAPPPTTPPALTTIAVTPGRDTLVSINQTRTLAAAGKDAAGAPFSVATFTWTSSDPAIATVDAAGLVKALKNGSVTMTATSGSVSGTATIIVQQRAALIELTSGDNQGGTVRANLDSVVVATARDALGSLAAGVSIRWAPAPDAGEVTPTMGVTDATGKASAQWKLGFHTGIRYLLAVSAIDAAVVDSFTATASADVPNYMYALSGDDQTELASTPLPLPLRTLVIDKYGNGVPDVPLTFSSNDGGSLEFDEVLTDLDGIATNTWTLGPSVGYWIASAVLPDSIVGDIVSMPGSPAEFSAYAVTFSLGTVTPATLVVGDTMFLAGTGFHPDPGTNGVTVDGVPALVVSGTQSLLKALVPSFGCLPTKTRTVALTRGATTLSTTAPVQPASALQLAVGATRIVDNPADYCLQFLSAAGGTDEYLVGLTATRPLNGEVSLTLTAEDGVTTPAPAFAAPIVGPVTTDLPRAREMALRGWEASFLGRRRGLPRPLHTALAPVAVPNVGDVLPLRVPDIRTDPCNAYLPVNAKILAVGTQLIVATDATLPVDGPSVVAITAALNAFTGTFGSALYGMASTFFGVPTDLDQNGRIIILLSAAVGTVGVPGFASAVDLVDRATCPASDYGEILYVAIPASPSAAGVAAVLAGSQPGLAHDLTHVVQLSRRLAAGGVPLAGWLGEAQAELGTELVGLALKGGVGRMDYGASVVNGDSMAAAWYRPRFDRLSYLFGWDGASGTKTGAPERCSLYGFRGAAIACDPAYSAGAAWSFLRFLSDRIAGVGANESAFLKALVDLDPQKDGIDALEALAGKDFDRLVVDWAMTLYADGRLAPGTVTDLKIGSWNLADIYGALPAAQRLAPATRAFTSFARAGSVVGGGTFYTSVSAAGSHGPLAIRVRDGAGNALGAELAPRFWVMRIK